jgi:DNA-nicking Smr family endonuclease
MSDEEISDFASLMKGDDSVRDIKREPKAGDEDIQNKTIQSKKIGLDKNKENLRKAALGESSESGIEVLRTLKPETYDANDVIGFKKPGVQEGVYKKLRTGRYPIEAKLDLHGLIVEEALHASLTFIEKQFKKQKRCVLISHGKGMKQVEPARLKNHVAVWLKHIPEVMAYHSAMSQHGGSGNVYVLLQKGEKKKQQNRERFNGL